MFLTDGNCFFCVLATRARCELYEQPLPWEFRFELFLRLKCSNREPYSTGFEALSQLRKNEINKNIVAGGSIEEVK